MRDRRIPTWLTTDLIIIVLGMVIIGVGIWIGFDGHSLPSAALDRAFLTQIGL